MIKTLRARECARSDRPEFIRATEICRLEATEASRRQIDVMQGAKVVETFRRELPASKVLDHDVRNT